MKNETWLEETKRKGHNNRILGFVIGVLFTLSALIIWEIL
jgi:tetrahydromethanopterin S-methyltransferase subunit F